MFGWLQELIDAIVNAITGGFKSAANEVTNFHMELDAEMVV